MSTRASNGDRPLARPDASPAALQQAARFPALSAIFSRRSRRFALGAELTGPLAHRSAHDPLPLAERHQTVEHAHPRRQRTRHGEFSNARNSRISLCV